MFVTYNGDLPELNTEKVRNASDNGASGYWNGASVLLCVKPPS